MTSSAPEAAALVIIFIECPGHTSSLRRTGTLTQPVLYDWLPPDERERAQRQHRSPAPCLAPPAQRQAGRRRARARGQPGVPEPHREGEAGHPVSVAVEGAALVPGRPRELHDAAVGGARRRAPRRAAPGPAAQDARPRPRVAAVAVGRAAPGGYRRRAV